MSIEEPFCAISFDILAVKNGWQSASSADIRCLGSLQRRFFRKSAIDSISCEGITTSTNLVWIQIHVNLDYVDVGQLGYFQRLICMQSLQKTTYPMKMNWF